MRQTDAQEQKSRSPALVTIATVRCSSCFRHQLTYINQKSPAIFALLFIYHKEIYKKSVLSFLKRSAHCADSQFGLRETNLNSKLLTEIPQRGRPPWRSTNNWWIIRTLFSSIHYSAISLQHIPPFPAADAVTVAMMMSGFACSSSSELWATHTRRPGAEQGKAAAESSNRHDRGRIFVAPLSTSA